jgi:hypothetical protein
VDRAIVLERDLVREPVKRSCERSELHIKGQITQSILTILCSLQGSVAQETDFAPNTTDVASWTWTQYEDYVTRKLSPFRPGVAETALGLYPSHVITPEYQLTSLASDHGTICGSGNLAFRVYNRQGFSAPIYRYR